MTHYKKNDPGDGRIEIMVATVQPSLIQGTLQAPASKSSMQRACAAALLSNGASVIRNPGVSNDDLAALDVIRVLGARIVSQNRDGITIESSGVQPIASSMNCGEAGLGLRMFAPIAALSDKEITIYGSGSLLKRPMHFFDEIFPALGIRIESQNGYLPLRIQGPLRPADIEIDGSLSSQFLTGLLMAYAASGTHDASIKVRDLKSKPYIDLTLQVMKDFGVTVEHENYEVFHFKARTEKGFKPAVYTVEGDWSGGAFLLVAGAIAGPVSVKGLSLASTQADKAIMGALHRCGAIISTDNDRIDIDLAALNAFEFDATDCPDLFPPLVALAAYCKGDTLIRGTSRLTHKESNRALTLQEEFGKMGLTIDLEGDTMKVHGGKGLSGAVVHSRHDHRIAMACAVAALRATGNTVIEVAEAIDKSYPRFYEDLQSLGAVVSLGKENGK